MEKAEVSTKTQQTSNISIVGIYGEGRVMVKSLEREGKEREEEVKGEIQQQIRGKCII